MSVNLVDTTNAERCNRQARLVPADTSTTYGTVPMTLVGRTVLAQDDFDTYRVSFGYGQGHVNEVGVFNSAFVATHFLPVHAMQQAETMARVTGSRSATWREECRDSAGHLVTLFSATWTREA